MTINTAACRACALGAALILDVVAAADNPHRKPTSSSPIAITSNDRYVWVVNPDNDSVSVLDVRNDRNEKVAEIPVGEGPRSIAILPDDSRVYVTNQRSRSVSVIDTDDLEVIETIKVGREPIGCALRPDGKRLFVANSSSGTVSVIRTSSNRVIETVKHVGPKPYAIACTDKRVYVTLFLAQPRDDDRSPDEREGRDDGSEGRVVVISATSYKIKETIALEPLEFSGFSSNGSVLDGIGPTDPPSFTFPTGAFPNLLGSIVIKGDRAYLPNTASSPNGPVRFDSNVQSFLSVLDIEDEEDSGQTINMNAGVQFEPPGVRLFITNPIAIAFRPHSDEGFVVSAATDRLVRVELDNDGTPTINAPAGPGDPGGIVRVEVGVDAPGEFQNSNPQGIVIDSEGERAYVFNFITRDVSVVDISGDPSEYEEIDRIPSADLPAPGSLEAIVHRGNELFNTAIGPPGTNENALPPAGRMSSFGWGSCYSCHPSGLTDGVTWMFGDGPRQTISMESTAEHPQPSDALLNPNGAPLLPSFKQRVLNWSAVRDEIQDFELNIRGVSGGQGLITDGQAVANLTPTATTGRSADLDAIAAYIAFGIQAPISPKRGNDVGEGRGLFGLANCQSCHGGPNWTRSRVDFTPPPLSPPEVITAGQLVRFLFPVGTFDAAAANELRPAGAAIVPANGVLGFNVPSLLSVFAGAPYLHNGTAPALRDVLDDVAHRSAGTGGVDVLSDSDDRRELVRFLESIDESTPTFP